MLWRNSKFKPIFGFHRRLLLCYEAEAHFQCENSSPMLCSTLMCDSVTSPCGLGPPLFTLHLTAEPLQLSYFLNAKTEPKKSGFSLAWHMLYTGDVPCLSNNRKKILATGRGMVRNVLLRVLIAQTAVISIGRALVSLQGAESCATKHRVFQPLPLCLLHPPWSLRCRYFPQRRSLLGHLLVFCSFTRDFSVWVWEVWLSGIVTWGCHSQQQG